MPNKSPSNHETRTPAWRQLLQPHLDELWALALTREQREDLGLGNAAIKLRYLIVGDSGRGQELVADALASEMKRLELLTSARVAPTKLDAFHISITAIKQRDVAPPENVTDGASGHSYDCIWMLEANHGSIRSSGATPPGRILRDSLNTAVNHPGFAIPLVVCLDRDMLSELEKDSILTRHFSRRIELPRVAAADLADEISYQLSERAYSVPFATRREIEARCDRVGRLDLTDAAPIADDIVLAHSGRVRGSGTKKTLSDIKSADLDVPALSTKPRRPLPEVMAEFDDLIGLERVRDYLDGAAALATTRRNNAAAGASLGAHLDNFVFTGPPGTGKTTVARKLGEVFAALGLLNSGHVVSRDRASIVGSHVGESEIRMKEAIEEARHGVLFIDEAYGLADNAESGGRGGSSATDSRNYGALALQRLLTAITDPECQPFVCIVAGYPAEMEWFLKSNPGLASRFTARLDFDSYPDDVLGEIFAKAAERKKLKVDMSTRRSAVTVLAELRDAAPQAFGNAREAINLVEKAVQEASQRVFAADGKSAVVTELTPEDIDSAREALGLKARGSGDKSDPVINPVLERAATRIKSERSWSDSSKDALVDHLDRVRKGESFGFATSLPRAVSDVLVTEPSGVDLKALAGILAEFYLSLGSLTSKKSIVLNHRTGKSEAELVAIVDSTFEKAEGRCVLIPCLEDWLPKKSASTPPQAVNAITDRMRRNRNELLVLARASRVPSRELAGVPALLDEFELKLG